MFLKRKENNIFGQKIKELRIKKGLSCAELARRTGHPVSTIHGIETGANKNPRFEIICDLSDTLDVDMEYMKKIFKV